jgi:hypothetical protein
MAEGFSVSSRLMGDTLRSLGQEIFLTSLRGRKQLGKLGRTAQLCPYGIVLQTRISAIMSGNRTFDQLNG